MASTSTHQGLLYAYGPDWEERVLEAARQPDALPGGLIGASRTVQGVCVRALATNGDALYRLFLPALAATNGGIGKERGIYRHSLLTV